MTSKPMVSIVIPVYNGSDFLETAIQSALAQDYENFEVIVVNDGSNDGGKTDEIIQKYQRKIRSITKPNGGVASALNMGVSQMRGEYFSWLSHDDIYFPYKLSVQIEFLRTQPDGAIAFGDFDMIDKTGHVVGVNKRKPIESRFFRPALLAGFGPHGCSMLIPRSTFERYGCFKEHLRDTQDYDLWLEFGAAVPIVHQQKSLIQSRFHENQGSVKNDTRAEEYRLYTSGVHQLTEAELQYSGGPADTYLDIALSLLSWPKRSSAAPEVMKLYARTERRFSLRRFRRRLWYEFRLWQERRAGHVLSPQEIARIKT